MSSNQFSCDYQKNQSMFHDLLRVEKSFDVVQRNFYVADLRASLFFIDGFAKDEVMEKILEYLTKITPEQLKPLKKDGKMPLQAFTEHFMTYIETTTEKNADTAVTQVLSGVLALLVEGLDQIILIDARTYPAREPEEPENERTLRGAHDGFCETLVFNTAMIRRRIRDPRLTMEYVSVKGCHTDMVICYVEGEADEKCLNRLRKKLAAMDTKSLHMGQQSVIETLLGGQWLNPFPRVRFTERPDSAAASVQEGQIVLLTDTSPQAIVLPCSIFTFMQDINDFYFPPLVGTYLRLVRFAVGFITLFLTPVWFLVNQNPNILPDAMKFVLAEDSAAVPLLWQLIIIELLLDGLKLASLNTPNALSNSFSVVGALLLGDLAIGAGWFSEEVVLYMAFVAIANFTLTSFELSYAIKLNRILMLVFIRLWNYWGIVIALILLGIQLFTVKTLSGYQYMAPLIPFRWKELSSLLVRRTKKE